MVMHARFQGETTALGREADPAAHTMIDSVAPKAVITIFHIPGVTDQSDPEEISTKSCFK
jgi:hypothetical protein